MKRKWHDRRVGARRRHLLAAAVALSACATQDSLPEVPEPVPLDVPVAADAAFPSVVASDDRVLVSWLEPEGDGHRLRFASWDGAGWSDARSIASGPHWFVNWADFPGMLALDDGNLLAYWLQRSGPGRYAYDVMLTRSADAGATWTQPVRPHRDGTESEHGFVSLFAHGDGAGLIWLDGRQFGGEHAEHNEMMLRFTTVAPDGTLGSDDAIDARVCDCCQTAAVVTSSGPIVFYRDRSEAEIRDIAYARLVGGRWTESKPVHEDGWHITGCPVNGPQAAAAGNSVVVAWFTAANDSPRVNVAFSADGGESFATPVRIDDGEPLGRVDVVMLRSGAAFVVWLERQGEEAELRGRLVLPDRLGPSRMIAGTSAQRAAGFPRMAVFGSRVLLAWTDAPAQTVRAAVLTLE